MFFCDCRLSLSVIFSRFVCVIIFTSFVFIVESYSIVEIYHTCSSIHKSVNMWVVSTLPHVLHTRNATMNSCVKFLYGYVFSYHGINLGTGLLGYMVTLYLTFWGTVKVFGKWLLYFVWEFHHQCTEDPLLRIVHLTIFQLHNGAKAINIQ